MRNQGYRIIQLHALRNSHNGDICHLIHRACAQDLNAQEFPGGRLRRHFTTKGRGSRIIVGLSSTTVITEVVAYPAAFACSSVSLYGLR